ncbi:MAG: HAD-IB family hydrolase [Deltaproteobacteria bacterium]|nr:HAD-IB family hydrolase [Deltaproteobacteria bacterium]
MAAMRQAAFFDLDGTLVGVNTGALWMREERRAGRLRLRHVAVGALYMAAYRFRAVDMERAMVRALTTIKGEREEVVRKRTHDWWRSSVVPWIAPGAASAVEEHRAQGHLLVLLTSSSPYASEIAARHFGLDAVLCTAFEVKDGRFTGDVVRPICYGEGKVVHAERFAAQAGVSLDESFFYTDSFTDLPMLERVGHARTVGPDLRLRITARRRGWPVLDW